MLVPAGVDDITAVVIILLEGNPKDKSWGAAQKLMNNVDKFLERLRGYKGIIDQGQVRYSYRAAWQSSNCAKHCATHAGYVSLVLCESSCAEVKQALADATALQPQMLSCSAVQSSPQLAVLLPFS